MRLLASTVIVPPITLYAAPKVVVPVVETRYDAPAEDPPVPVALSPTAMVLVALIVAPPDAVSAIQAPPLVLEEECAFKFNVTSTRCAPLTTIDGAAFPAPTLDVYVVELVVGVPTSLATLAVPPWTMSVSQAKPVKSTSPAS